MEDRSTEGSVELNLRDPWIESGPVHQISACAKVRYGPNQRFIVSLLFIAVLLLNEACQAGTLQLEYVFPDGFRGAAIIRENQNDGMPACEIPWLPRTEVCVLNFPASGVIHTQGVSPTTIWHRATARYANGTAIPVPNRAAGIIVAEDEVAVWYGQGVEGEGWLFVGTSDEFREFNAERSRPKY